MKKSLFLFLLCVYGFALVSDSEAQTKFDIVTYTAPAGWAVEKSADSITFTTGSNGNYCAITLTRSTESIGDSGKNFDVLWKAMATDELNAGEITRGKGGDKDGWQAELGIAPFEKGDIKGAAFLTTFTGNGKVIAILALTNGEQFQKDIETFVNNVKLPPIAVQKTPVAAPGAPSTGDKNAAATSGSLNARYSCLKLAYRNGSSVYDPAGLGFTVSGGSYSVVGGTGGKVLTGNDSVEFSGGRLNGYRGEIRDNNGKLYIFFRVNFTEIRRNESIRFGDMQCYRQ